MQKTEGMAKTAQRKTGTSTTLNRRYVKRPNMMANTATTSTKKSSSIQHFRNESSNVAVQIKTAKTSQQTETIQKHPLQVSAISKMQKTRSQQMMTKKQEEKKMTAKEMKDRAIQQALVNAATVEQTDSDRKTEKQKLGKMHFGFGRVALALSCAALAVFAIVYFVNLNMPDLSLRVAAMQTGINASYPGYIPRDYKVSSITSENKKIILDFKHNTEEGAFSLTEETSSWDSNALLNNFVRGEYGDNYKTVKEQGLTIYISGSDAAWVNGGIVYKIIANGNEVLTNKQICSIATSL